MAQKKRSRLLLSIIALILVVSALVYAFWPRPTLVDISTVSRGHMMLTVDEEARTRVHDSYVVSAPVSSRMLRIDLEPGDEVIQGETVVARFLPASPSALNLRQRQQAQAAVTSARAALEAARAQLKRATAERDLARTTYQRKKQQFDAGAVSQAILDKAEQELQTSEAVAESAKADIAVRQAEVKNAEAALIGVNVADTAGEQIELLAPVSGRVLTVVQESETFLTAGQPVLEIGNVEEDLEILVELVSTDAVKVQTGNRVIIDNWGGDGPLEGEVVKVYPSGFTKYSALGVEEQRVNTIIRFTGDVSDIGKLGHGYRVEVNIVIWESDDAVIVPTSALFRDEGQWSVFIVEEEKARLRSVEIGRNNGLQASVTSGLQPGDQVILYPPAEIENGTDITPRRNESSKD